ncbi:EAL domain-containing protein [Actinoplanes sp. LDG1-06]|uniref:EAL domain-containing protein n=1 Tax=Paractinoplanes ovalisporus TaxID=2810368 RepID=A0ABS2AEE7_9ACTN|nr:EAL domain-containing protein [Actinoplanes ovalisporus]MBM2618140.1 EAL domain-containing protein [Actinoplanes ovalisporus]
MGVLRGRPGRPLLASGLLLLFAVVAFAINSVEPVIPWVVLWLPGVIAAGVLGVESRRTARTEHLPPQVRQFWGRIAVVCVPVGLGNAAQAYHVLSAPDPARAGVGAGQIVFQGIAVLLVMYALLRLPYGTQTRGELFRVVLDASTVMLACAVFLWHFSARYALEDDPRMQYPALALSLLALLAVFAVAKFLLTSQNHMAAGALRMIGVAVAIGALGPILRPLIAPVDPNLFPDMIDLPALFFCAAIATRRQRAARTGPLRGAKPVRRRPFSFLPYLAVAAVDGLLLAVSWQADSADRRIVVVAAVLLTAVVVIRQMTAFRDNGRLLQRLDHGATHDALTQLPNRVLFHERLRRAVEAPDRRPVAVALIDLDDFKEVNDTLGHEVGDQLLIAVAQRLNGCVRAEDTVARLGGDEFVVVLDGADPQAADLAAQRMIDSLRAPVSADGHELPIRASIGIADGRAGDDPSVMLRQADIAMYAAKAIPGTASLHYQPEMAGNADLGAELPGAIRDDQLFLLFQPIVALDGDRRVLGAEALVRWAHPAHGTLAPDAFIPVAERTGMIVPLSRWVLRAVLSRMSAWPAGTAVNINISARDLREPDFAETVAGLLAEHGVAPGRVTLEITESMPVEPGESLAVLRDLRDLGVKFALDDFGTGSSTLSLLHDVPVDEVKLDRSFSQAAPDDRLTVAAGVAHLAQAMSLHAVAEGVETEEQAERLRGLGYRAAQGYLFARPMPAADFEAMLPLTSVPA